MKNDSRPRKIALTRTARWAVQQLYRRALELGSADPDDFLFPFWIHPASTDPERPASKTFLAQELGAPRQGRTGHPRADVGSGCPVALIRAAQLLRRKVFEAGRVGSYLPRWIQNGKR